jgi:hypothetical protein
MFLVFLSSDETTVVSTSDFIFLESLEPFDTYMRLTLLLFRNDSEGYFSRLPLLRMLEASRVEKLQRGLNHLSCLF